MVEMGNTMAKRNVWKQGKENASLESFIFGWSIRKEGKPALYKRHAGNSQ
jgi:hypothetical protein